MEIYSTLHYLHLEGEKLGRERGRRLGACQQLGKLLLRHGKLLFGPPAQEERAALDRLVEREGLGQLEQARDRLPAAASWAELLAGLEAPQGRPPEPDFLMPQDVDPTPMPPSIDEHMKVTRGPRGEKAIIHLRMQRLYQDNIGRVLYRESQRLRAEHHCSVETVVLLLWPGADGPAMTGEHAIPTGGTFTYHLTRLWEKDADEMLVGGLATLPYASLGKFDPARLPTVRRLDEGIEAHAKNAEARTNLWVVAYGSLGLRYPAEQVHALLAHRLPFIHQTEPCRSIKSGGYHLGKSRGLAEGALAASRRWALALGERRLGPPPPGLPEALASLRGAERLEQTAARALKADNWPEVLAPG